jgi:chromosome segregation ATPase
VDGGGGQVRELQGQLEELRRSGKGSDEQMRAMELELAQAKAEITAAAEERVRTAEAAAAVAKEQAALATVDGAARQQAVAMLTQQIRELETLLSYAVDPEEVAALEAALASATTNAEAAAVERIRAAEAEAEAARREASLSKLAAEARQQAVWALSQQVQDLEQELKTATLARRNALNMPQTSLYEATKPLREAQSRIDRLLAETELLRQMLVEQGGAGTAQLLARISQLRIQADQQQSDAARQMEDQSKGFWD